MASGFVFALTIDRLSPKIADIKFNARQNPLYASIWGLANTKRFETPETKCGLRLFHTPKSSLKIIFMKSRNMNHAGIPEITREKERKKKARKSKG
jgi:hypothetical protein